MKKKGNKELRSRKTERLKIVKIGISEINLNWQMYPNIPMEK